MVPRRSWRRIGAHAASVLSRHNGRLVWVPGLLVIVTMSHLPSVSAALLHALAMARVAFSYQRGDFAACVAIAAGALLLALVDVLVLSSTSHSFIVIHPSSPLPIGSGALAEKFLRLDFAHAVADAIVTAWGAHVAGRQKCVV